MACDSVPIREEQPKKDMVWTATSVGRALLTSVHAKVTQPLPEDRQQGSGACGRKTPPAAAVRRTALLGSLEVELDCPLADLAS